MHTYMYFLEKRYRLYFSTFKSLKDPSCTSSQGKNVWVWLISLGTLKSQPHREKRQTKKTVQYAPKMPTSSWKINLHYKKKKKKKRYTKPNQTITLKGHTPVPDFLKLQVSCTSTNISYLQWFIYIYLYLQKARRNVSDVLNDHKQNGWIGFTT